MRVAAQLIAATFILGLLFDNPPDAEMAPWCQSNDEYTHCAYPTFQSCLQAANGLGGFCFANPRRPDAPPAPRGPYRSR
jgi:hypothetical protein